MTIPVQTSPQRRMKTPIKAFALAMGFLSTASLAADPEPAANPAVQAMSLMQGSIFTFVAFTVGSVAVGVLLGHLIGRKSEAVRASIFSLSVFSGMSLAVLNHLGKLPW